RSRRAVVSPLRHPAAVAPDGGGRRARGSGRTPVRERAGDLDGGSDRCGALYRLVRYGAGALSSASRPEPDVLVPGGGDLLLGNPVCGPDFVDRAGRETDAHSIDR